MSKNINIIVNLKYHKFYSKDPIKTDFKNDKEFNKAISKFKESSFYRCKDSGNILSYLTRTTAIDKIPPEDRKIINTLESITDSNPHNDIFEYADKRPGSTGAFDLSGDIDKAKMKEIKEALNTTQSTVWSGVLSFSNEYGSLHCSCKNDAKFIFKESIKTLLIKQGLNPDNISLFAAYHNNTDHPHIHFFYWENEKLNIDKNGNSKFSNFKIPLNAIDAFKIKVAAVCNSQNRKIDFSLRDTIRESFKKNNVEDTRLELFLKLEKKLEPNHSFQYGRLSNNNKTILNNFIDDFIEANPILKKNWNDYQTRLLTMQKDIIKLYQENNVKPTNEALSFSKSRIDELYSRCGNEILKTLKILCDSQDKINKNSTIITPQKEKKYGSKNSKILIHNNSNTKYVLRNLFAHLMSDKNNNLNRNINSVIKQFYDELEARGEKGIYSERE